MSHFTVLVIGDNAEEQLIPFKEYDGEENFPKEFLEWNDVEEECAESYETEMLTRVVMPDGRLLSIFDDAFRIPGQIGIGTGTHKVPDHLEKRDIPVKEEYPTLEKYIREYCGYRHKHPETGKFGYWNNPNSKWDWYLLGGRWTGFFKVKAGIASISGKPGLMTEQAKPGWGDSLLKKHIDVEFMRKEAEDEAVKRYDAAMNVIDGTPIHRTWESICKEVGYGDVARNMYQNQERVKAWEYANDEIFGHFSSADEFLISREEYVRNAVNEAITTFAIIKDGKWYEKGKMGWWGAVSDKKEDSEWAKEFNSLFDSLPDDAILSVYDCHI